MEWRRREDWGARPPKAPFTSLNPDRVNSIYLHHTTGEGRADSAAWIKAIQKFHQDDRGWNDIGYCWLVDRYGVIWEGRGNVVGAHTGGYNSVSLGVAFLGDGAKPVPPEALRSIKYLIENLSRNFPIRQVAGHRNVGRTACPGDWLYGWLLGGMPVEEPVPLPEPKKPAPPAEAYQSPVPDLRKGWRRLGRLRGWR